MNIETSWQWLGWSAWILIPAWICMSFALWHLRKREWHSASMLSSVSAWALRCISIAILLLMLAEPIISQQQRREIKPQLTIVLDHSASMQHLDQSLHPSYQFDEQQALGMLDHEQRPRIARECHDLLRSIRNFLSELSKRPLREKDSQELLAYGKSLQPMLSSLIGHQFIGDRVQDICNLLLILSNKIENNDAPQIQSLLHKIDATLLQALQGLQQHADSALAAGANASDQLQTSIKEWKTLTRLQRSEKFIQDTLTPALGAQATIQIVPLHAPSDTYTSKQDVPHAQQMRSDYYQCFDTLNRQLGGEQQQHILLLSDGLHNGDKDPLPVARALGARGIPIDTMIIGDFDQPRDAVVLDIIGPSEMYRADDIPITVRYRITEYPGQNWDLIITINGTEYDRRIVSGNGLVQEQHFTVSELAATRLIIEAKLQAHVDMNTLKQERKAWHEEIWDTTHALDLFDFFNSELIPTATSDRFILSKEIQHNRQDAFIRRLRSYIIPSSDGWYQFFISGDDRGALWLSTDHRPAHKSLLAYFDEPCKESEWNKFPSQQSQAVYLRKDQPYYLELTHQDISHFDRIQIAWKKQAEKDPKPLSDDVLIPFGDDAIATHLLQRNEHNTQNNSKEHIIITHSDPLRILLLDQYPRWETRLLVSLLGSDEGIQIDKLFVGLQKQSQIESFFASLEQYDALILGDVSASLLSNEYQDRLAHAVREHGLLLIVIAGRQSMPHGFALGALANVLPVRVNSTQSDQNRLWHLQALSNDSLTSLDNRQWDWTSLPAFSWINGHVTAKPEATIHLTVNSKDGTQIPYCCSQHIGAGRVVYFGSDESWRWRQQIGKLEHRKWWRHVMQWGLQSRLHGSNPRLRVAISQRQADHAHQILVHARCLDNGSVLNDGLSVAIQQLDGKQQSWLLQMPAGPQSQTSLCIGDHLELGPGQYRCTVQSSHLPHLLEEREFWIRPPHHTELNQLGTDLALLKRISQTSQGKTYTANDYQSLIHRLKNNLKNRSITQTHIVHFWRHWYLLLAAVSLLTLEWWLRKRSGLP